MTIACDTQSAFRSGILLIVCVTSGLSYPNCVSSLCRSDNAAVEALTRHFNRDYLYPSRQQTAMLPLRIPIGIHHQKRLPDDIIFDGKPGTRINKPAARIGDVSNTHLPIDYNIRQPGSILIVGNGSTYFQVLHM